MVRELEAIIWCPHCHADYARVFRVQTNEVVWEHVKEPETAPSLCPRCDTILERR